jgi:hypothetical protein
MSEDRLLEARNRAARAEMLVNDELLTEGFANLEAAYIEAWKLTTPSDQIAREKLYLAVNVVGKLKQHLQAVITDGKLADAELKELIEQQERKKRFGII